jgi:mRNA-degrading endonuclease RelE of RelBE toxin-antitoxin system
MTVMFTDLAVSRLRELVERHRERVRDVLRRIENLRDKTDILRLPRNQHLGHQDVLDIFLFWVGTWRVILATSDEKPNTVFIVDILP